MRSEALSVIDLGKRFVVGSGPRITSLKELRLVPRRRPATSTWALRHVSFDVYPGEVLGVLGQNGAGKSTLLTILARITEPTEGRAEIRGRVASLLEVGTGFHPELSGRDNVFLNGVILGMPRREVARKFDEIVEFAELRDYIDMPIKRYSSGMVVRLGFAVAAHLDPDVLLLDEVLAVGDVPFQEKSLARVRELTSDGRAVLFVSHDPSSVERLCERAIVLDGGCIVHDGDVTTALDLYVRTHHPISVNASE
jgi:lipopolysaccharide transport system ATP-binding protein